MMMLIFPKMNQVFPTKSKYDEYCDVLGIETIDDNLYTHMMIEYGESTFRYLSHDTCAAKVIRIMSLQYPIYVQKKEAIEALRELELADYSESAISISNVAQNPNNAPVDEILPYVSTQQVTKAKLSQVDTIVSKYRITLYEYTRTVLRELAPLFRGIHSEKEDMFPYDIKEN